MESIYVTVTHLEEFCCLSGFRPKERLIIAKDRDNIYDDEALLVMKENGFKCGYVANSCRTAARGTFSAGRLYDRFDEKIEAEVCFVFPDTLIARVIFDQEANDAK